MGILSSGLLGPIRNKVGSSVSRLHRNKNVVSGIYKTRKTKPTDKQLVTQTKFSLLNSFLSKIKYLVIPGFRKYAKQKNEINAAYEFNFPHAFIEENDALSLNFAELKYSRGRIATPDEPEVTVIDDQLNFSWLTLQQHASCQFTDLASFLLYNSDKNEHIRLIGVVDRYAGSYSVVIPERHHGHTLHCYMSFASADAKLAGDSTYIGAFICSPSKNQL